MGLSPNDPVVIEGTVQGLQLTGIGPNSGELTLTLNTPSVPGGTTQVFAGIMDSNHAAESGIEHGVFASYVTLASVANTTQRRIRCSYLVRDKNRINSLTLL